MGFVLGLASGRWGQVEVLFSWFRWGRARLVVLKVGQEDKGALPPRLLQRTLHQDAVPWLKKVHARCRAEVRVRVVEEDGAHERGRAVGACINGFCAVHWAAAPEAAKSRREAARRCGGAEGKWEAAVAMMGGRAFQRTTRRHERWEGIRALESWTSLACLRMKQGK